MRNLALVDYNNLCGRDIDSQAKAEFRTTELLDRLAAIFRSEYPCSTEIDVRLYGGWVDEYGLPSPAANRLLPILPALRGRRYGMIVRPSLATAMVGFPDTILKGTVRLRSKRRHQKMVDAMMGCDAICAVAAIPARVALVTDDDDLVPAALSANAVARTALAWIRPRPVGQGLNDGRLTRRGIQINGIGKYKNG